jgi:hypothetical protein
MPKTGTSSIQDSLFLGLSDPRFRYIQLTGHPNSAHFLEPLFRDDYNQLWMHRQKGISKQKIYELKTTFSRKLRRALQRSKKDQTTAIISAECCWNYSAGELQSLRQFIEACGLDIEVIIYLRPIKSWIESNFQESIKYNVDFTDIGQFNREFRESKISYTDRLKTFEDVFGRQRLTVRPFRKELLADGCVVRDFCQAAGINYTSRMIRRTNDGISQSAVRLLYSYHHFSQHSSQQSFAAHHLLLMRLGGLQGDPFRLHSDLLAPLLKHIESQNQSILEKYGVDLSENVHAADDGPCIRHPEDLLRFSPCSLHWLARESKSTPIALREGQAAAHAVASQMVRLLQQPAWSYRLRRLIYNLRLKFRSFTHAV